MPRLRYSSAVSACLLESFCIADAYSFAEPYNIVCPEDSVDESVVVVVGIAAVVAVVDVVVIVVAVASSAHAASGSCMARATVIKQFDAIVTKPFFLFLIERTSNVRAVKICD